eukprot:762132-Hanusia_phi.AAC.4
MNKKCRVSAGIQRTDDELAFAGGGGDSFSCGTSGRGGYELQEPLRMAKDSTQPSCATTQSAGADAADRWQRTWSLSEESLRVEIPLVDASVTAPAPSLSILFLNLLLPPPSSLSTASSPLFTQ